MDRRKLPWTEERKQKLRDHYADPEVKAEHSRKAKEAYNARSSESLELTSEKLKEYWTPEKRKEQSERSRNIWTPERRQKQSETIKAYHASHPFSHSEETKAAISARMKEVWQDEEYRASSVKKHTGYKPSPQTIEKCREASDRFWNRPEAREEHHQAMLDFWEDIKTGKRKFNER